MTYQMEFIPPLNNEQDRGRPSSVPNMKGRAQYDLSGSSGPGRPNSAGSNSDSSSGSGALVYYNNTRDIESAGSKIPESASSKENEGIEGGEFIVVNHNADSSSFKKKKPKSALKKVKVRVLSHISNNSSNSNTGVSVAVKRSVSKEELQRQKKLSKQLQLQESAESASEMSELGLASPTSIADAFVDSPHISHTSINTNRDNSQSPSAKARRKGPRVKSIRFSATNEIRMYTPNPKEFEIDGNKPTDVYGPNYNSAKSKIRNFFVVRAIPFTYGASSSLTTLYFFLELVTNYGLSSKVIGAYLSAAYFTRVVFTSISRYAPKTFVLLGSVAALVGFGMVFLSQRPESFWIMNDEGLTFFILGSIFANSNETISATQMLVRDQHLENVKILGSKLKVHFFMSKLARVFTFAVSGFLYQNYGVEGVALYGAGMVCLQILCLIAYFFLDIYRIHHDPNNAFGEDFIAMKPECRPTFSIRAARGKRRLFKSAMSKLNKTLGKYYPSDVPQNIIRFIIPLGLFGLTLSSMCIWASTALIVVDDFSQGYLVLGTIFAAASALDLITSSFLLSKGWDTKFRKLMPEPYNFFMGLFGITLASALVAVPSFSVFVTGFMLYSIFSSLLSAALTEVQGSSNNATEPVTSQVMRRLCTAGSLFALPFLHALHPRLPFILGLWYALISSVTFTVYMWCFPRGDDVELDEAGLQSTATRNRPSRRPERNLVRSERVMLARLMKGKDV